MKIRHFVIGLAVAVIANMVAMYLYEKIRKKKDAIQ
jgi:uncharacterized membrane protein